ncbi:MAG TPA: DUF2914 domain-containing protein [Candidatus Omnitrophota bacterium]|nr:DUF2914 domain-containing protein [Candidatus Omnitrophota bacterium]
MVDFTGYAKKPEPKWMSMLLVLAGIVILIVAYTGFGVYYEYFEHGKKETKAKPSATALKPAPVQPAEKKALTLSEVIASRWQPTVTVESIVISSGIDENNQPVDRLDSVKISQGGKLYCYTRVKNISGSNRIRHVWIAPSGTTAADTGIDIDNNISNVWSYINLSGKSAGNWEVDVMTEDGRVLVKKPFRITD